VVRKRESIDTAVVADQRRALMRGHRSRLPLEVPQAVQVKCDLIMEFSVGGGD
jgi:hypothetical protein